MKENNEFRTRVSFDPVKLLKAYEELQKDVPRTLYNNIKDGKRIGWAMTSRTGKSSDIHGKRYRTYDNEKQFNIPTRSLQGYFQEIFHELEGVIGPLYRMRIITLEGFREIAPHHDGHDGTNFLRYHIPIIPNPKCDFMAMGKNFQMLEAGRLYRFPGWEIHAVTNHSGLRSHLMVSSYRDINEISFKKPVLTM